MKDNAIIKNLTLLLLIAILATGSIMVYVVNPVFSDQTTKSPSGLSDYFERRDFKIDPTTILEDLENGNTDVFIPLITTPEAYEKLYFAPPSWKQLDYLNVSSALYEFAWGDNVNDWLIENMSFYGDCQYDPLNFDLFKITYFQDNGSQHYAAREIDIFPLYGGAAIGGGTSFPKPLFGWKNINLEKLKITAEDALSIAEDNGGREFRLSHENKCEIFVLITSRELRWQVRYYSDNTIGRAFEVTINPFTGEFKIQE